MKKDLNKLGRVLSAGICVLIGLSVLLFWSRALPFALFERENIEGSYVHLQPSGLLPLSLEPDANNLAASVLVCDGLFPPYTPLFGLAEVPVDWPRKGIEAMGDIFRDMHDLRDCGINSDWLENWLLPVFMTGLENPSYPSYAFDTLESQHFWHPKHRLFVRSKLEKHKDSQGNIRIATTDVKYYGPNGMATTRETDLGRFTDPLFSYLRSSRATIVYDRATRRFYLLSEHKVTASTPIAETIDPIQLSYGNLNWQGGLVLGGPNFWGPQRWETDAEFTQRQERAKANYMDYGIVGYGFKIPPNESQPLKLERKKERQGIPIFNNKCMLVLDDSGKIYRINEETLSLSSPLGLLSHSHTKTKLPTDFLAYDARLTLYGDTVVTTLSRNGDSLTLDIFDPNGIQQSRTTAHREWKNFPGGRIAAALSYGAEVLHPPIFHGLSVVGFPSITPLESHRTLLMMPLGTPARQVHSAHEHPTDGVGYMFMSMAPMAALSLFLAMRVDRDAKRFGMKEWQRGIWTGITVLLGLAGFITYRITRPTFSQVTCANCGKPRRTDWEQCQHCQAPWQVPEMTAPAWRVVDVH